MVLSAVQNRLVLELRQSCDLHSDSDIEAYLHALAELRRVPSEAVLREVLLCLRDVEAGEVQFELVEACETYDSATYVRVMVSVCDRLQFIAPKWFRLMFQSVGNDPVSREQLTSVTMASPPTTCALVRSLAEALVNEYPLDDRYRRFLESIAPVAPN